MSRRGTRTICVYVPVADPEVLDRVEFYRQDLDALRATGATLVVTTRWAEIPWRADVYVIWWWTWAFLPLLVAQLARRPAIITGVFDYQWPEGGRDFLHRPFWQRWLMRAALRAADANVFVAECELRQVTSALPVTRAMYVPLGVDTTRYRPGDAPRQRLVVTISWLQADNARRKCLFEIVRAAAIVAHGDPSVRFVVAGVHDDAYDALRGLAETLGVGDRIEWPGRISTEEKVRLLQNCTVYLQPTSYEGFGLAILEAMSCGAAVVTSPVGAVPEVVGETAVLVEGRSPEQIAAAVTRLLSDPTLAAEFGRVARARALARFHVAHRQRALQHLVAELTAD
jgi:glycosyltransferase involved in cell wall biosynthesis